MEWLDLGGCLARTAVVSNFRLDGGAMFGQVPKPLWSRFSKADEQNRIPLVVRILLLRLGEATVLVEAGTGSDFDAHSAERLGLSGDSCDLGSALRREGIDPGEITHFIATHLHFDHVGGVGHPDQTGLRRPTLPSAKVYVQRSHWERARRPGPKEARSFRAEDLDIIEGMGLEFLDGEEEILPGLTVRPSQGHTAGLQMVIAQGAKDTLYYPSDLIPTLPHIRSAYTMGYDMWPDRLIEEKATLLEEIVEKDGLLVFVHDPQTAACRLQRGASGVSVRSKVTL